MLASHLAAVTFKSIPGCVMTSPLGMVTGCTDSKIFNDNQPPSWVCMWLEVQLLTRQRNIAFQPGELSFVLTAAITKVQQKFKFLLSWKESDSDQIGGNDVTILAGLSKLLFGFS